MDWEKIIERVIIIKLRKKIFVICFLLVISLTLTVQAEEEVDIDSFKNPEDITEFISVFSSLKYNMIETENEETSMERWIEYKYKGTEEVEDVSTDKITFRGSDEFDDTDLWVDEEGEIVKIEVENHEMTGEMAKTIGQQLTRMVLFPFSTFLQIYDEQLKEKIEDKKSQEKSKKQLGDIEVEVIEIDLEVDSIENDVEGWDWEAAGIKSGVVKFAEYEDVLILIGYEITYIKDIEKENEVNFTFEIESLELR